MVEIGSGAERELDAGVQAGLDFAIFQDHGYKGLYGCLGAKDIHNKKNSKRVSKY